MANRSTNPQSNAGNNLQADSELEFTSLINITRLKTAHGILRTMQLFLSLSAFICAYIAPTCEGRQLKIASFSADHIWCCIGPSITVFRMYLSITMLTFLSTLILHGFYITNLMDRIRHVPWNSMMLTHSGLSILFLFLVFCLLAADEYHTAALIYAQVAEFLCIGTFAVDMCRQVCHKRDSTTMQFSISNDSRNRSTTVDSESYSVEVSQLGNDNPGSDMPTLKIHRAKQTSSESLGTPRKRDNESLGSSSQSSTPEKTRRLSFDRYPQNDMKTINLSN